ncbi:hypothetical protein, partial [uncultured Corynebacterium sp.]|uniref:hypothetical protein n=1 Tax=uncultured Corynebacterium sp. TaxID=159447 RepID=UPI00259189C4
PMRYPILTTVLLDTTAQQRLRNPANLEVKRGMGSKQGIWGYGLADRSLPLVVQSLLDGLTCRRAGFLMGRA